MKTSTLIKWLADTREEYKQKQRQFEATNQWWFWYDGKIDLCNSLITLLKSDENSHS
jgi:hypothetical protein